MFSLFGYIMIFHNFILFSELHIISNEIVENVKKSNKSILSNKIRFNRNNLIYSIYLKKIMNFSNPVHNMERNMLNVWIWASHISRRINGGWSIALTDGCQKKSRKATKKVNYNSTGGMWTGTWEQETESFGHNMLRLSTYIHTHTHTHTHTVALGHAHQV